MRTHPDPLALNHYLDLEAARELPAHLCPFRRQHGRADVACHPSTEPTP